MDDLLDDPIGEGLLDLSWKNSFDVPMALDEAGLDVYEFRIWCHLARRSTSKGVAWPSTRTMSDDLGISRPIVIKSLKSLQEKNLLLIEHRQRPSGANSSNQYRCVPPCNASSGMVNRVDQGGQPRLPQVVNDVDQHLKILKVEDLKKEVCMIAPAAHNTHVLEKELVKATEKKNQGQQFFDEVESAIERHAANGKIPLGMPTLSVLKTEVARMGFKESDAEYLYDQWLTTGFTDGCGRKVKDWKASLRNRVRNGWLPSQRFERRPSPDREAEKEARMRQAVERIKRREQEQNDRNRPR